ncbi:MAG: hypothetical protein JWM53_2764 [bacterium]|nr:hypothetical protein [bacterium]
MVLLGVALAGPAAAQTFPAASAFVPFQCGGAPMTDALGDTPNATGALDLVGTNAFPAGLHAADAQFLYLRMRVAATPLAGGNMLQNDAWGFELDLDGDRTTYELLIAASGTNNTTQVAIYRHPTTVVADDPADPAVVPASFTYSFATHGRAIAADSTLSGAPDAFIDMALPWADLATVGVQRDTRVYVWAGSSTVANALDLDLACFGGAGGHLGGIDVGRTTPDPGAGGGGGGTGGTGGGGGTGPRTLEGGLGCSLSPRAATPTPTLFGLALVTLALALAVRRRAAR